MVLQGQGLHFLHILSTPELVLNLMEDLLLLLSHPVSTPDRHTSCSPDDFSDTDIPTVSHSPNYVPSRPSPTGPTRPTKRPSPTGPTKRPSPTGPTRPTKKDETPAPTLAPQTKSKGKAKKTTTDGEWEYNVRRRRRG